MPLPLFGREGSNPFETALNEGLNSTDYLDRAMARNLAHDDRVSPERQRTFEQTCALPCTTVETMRKLVRDYHTKHVRHTADPDYLHPRINGHNFVKLRNRDIRLARILDLSGLDKVYAWARDDRRHPEFLLAPSDADRRHKWLKGKLSQAGNTRTFIDVLFSMMAEYALIEPFHPVWATTWAALETSKGNSESWLDQVGLSKQRLPRWLLPLAYPVKETGYPIRPTQLDAGWNPYHFPSPANRSRSGHPMDVRRSLLASRLIPEYIHKPMRHNLRHWDEAGALIVEAVTPTTLSFVEARKRHFGLLESAYGRPKIKAWMPDPF